MISGLLARTATVHGGRVGVGSVTHAEYHENRPEWKQGATFQDIASEIVDHHPSYKHTAYGLATANLSVFVMWHKGSLRGNSYAMQYNTAMEKGSVLNIPSNLMTKNFFTSPKHVLNQARLHTLLTSGFSHIGFGHITMNMLAGGIFAYALSQAPKYGQIDYVSGLDLSCICCSGIVGGAFAHILLQRIGSRSYPLEAAMLARSVPLLGASGGVSSLIMAACLTSPREKVPAIMVFGPLDPFGWILWLPAIWMAPVAAIGDMIGLLRPQRKYAKMEKALKSKVPGEADKVIEVFERNPAVRVILQQDMSTEARKDAILATFKRYPLILGGTGNMVHLGGMVAGLAYYLLELRPRQQGEVPKISSFFDSACSSVRDMRSAGRSAKDLRAAGYSPRDMAAGGYTAKELVEDGGYTLHELRDSGIGVGRMRASGFSVQNLRAAGFKAEQLKMVGYSAKDLFLGGYTFSEMKGAGYTKRNLQEVHALPESH